MSIVEALRQQQTSVAVVGLGYVGLPLAVEFGKKVPTVGFDVNAGRIRELEQGRDHTAETSAAELAAAVQLRFSADPASLKTARFIIVAVPTPINKNKQPDLFCVRSASELVGRNLSAGAIVVFESTVYPGVTEEVCVPILERESGLICGRDFSVGYSPERINPGDKEHSLTTIVKVVSGMDAATLDEVAAVYSLVVQAGVYRAASIKCAEAAKVIENTQRDLNIALINELAIIFHDMGIDTREVLAAAGTKWNFVRMQPGLVGGHCIGVDPYYLTFKAEELGYHPQVILAGRRINDSMGKYIAEQTVKKLIEADKTVKGSTVAVLGITFKENVSDIRNSRVVDVIAELREYGITVLICDPLADPAEVRAEYGLELTEFDAAMPLDGIVLAVNHRAILARLSVDAIKQQLGAAGRRGVLIDVKAVFSAADFKDAPVVYWRL